MTTRSQSTRRLDPLALPIAFKLAFGLAIVLLFSGIATDRAIQQVVRDSQQAVVLSDLETISRSQALRMVDVLGQEVTALGSLGASEQLQRQLWLIAQIEEGMDPARIGFIKTDGLIMQFVQNFRQTHSEFDAVAVLDAQGHVRGIDPMPGLEVAIRDPSQSVWFTGAYNDGQGATFLSSPDDDHLTWITGIHIAVPIYDNSDPTHVIGVMYGIWNMANILNIADVGAEREGIVLEPDGSVMISPSNPAGHLTATDLRNRFVEDPAGSFVYREGDGTDWMYGYITLPGLEIAEPAVRNLRWTVITRQPVTAIQGNIGLLTTRLRLAIGLSALIVTAAVLGLTSLLLRPLRRLTVAATRLQGGDLAAPIPSLSADEVGRLADVLHGLVDRLLERLAELRTAVQISHATALTLDLTQMLGDVARSLTGQFGYPGARIYLLDSTGKRAYIQAASGAEAERLLRSGHRFTVDESTLIGRAILLGEPQIGAERERLREAGLMTGRSELVIPLQSGSRTQGAIHVLARRMGAFEPEDVDTLRLIADQLSASIENVRLFEQSAANLEEIEALNRRLTREAWEEYIGSSGMLRHTMDPEQKWPAASDAVGRSEEIRASTYEDADGRSVLAAPLILRGQTVGTLAITRGPGERWTRDEIALLESVAARMTMIADSIRLVDEASRRAAREERVNEVSANLLQRASSVDSVLRNALDELGGALGSDRVSLRLGPAPVDMDRQIGAGTGDTRGGPPAPSNGAGDQEDGGARSRERRAGGVSDVRP